MPPIVEIQHVQKIFRQRRKKTVILDDVNFVVHKGEIFGFLGANGVGKTTLLKCIFHFHHKDAGVIKLFGKENYYTQDVFQRIGYAPEQTFLYPFLTAAELLDYMGRLSGVDLATIKERGNKLIDTLWLSFARNRRIGAYSKGMKQRLSLAASLINDPELIFWDEPMSGLDPLGRILVKDLMRELKKEGKTLFFNTHILSDVQEIADTFAILHNGHIVYEDSPHNIEGSLEEFFTNTVRAIDEHVKVQ
jgi:ABC-2 type transport system ATP-binding protein